MPFFRSGSAENKSSHAENDNVSTLGDPAAFKNDDGAPSSLPLSSSSSSAPSPDAHPPGSSSRGGGTTGREVDAIVSEPWTRIFPEAFGIRRTVEDSPFRWCVRESFLWGVATGTMMGM